MFVQKRGGDFDIIWSGNCARPIPGAWCCWSIGGNLGVGGSWFTILLPDQFSAIRHHLRIAHHPYCQSYCYCQSYKTDTSESKYLIFVCHPWSPLILSTCNGIPLSSKKLHASLNVLNENVFESKTLLSIFQFKEITMCASYVMVSPPAVSLSSLTSPFCNIASVPLYPKTRLSQTGTTPDHWFHTMCSVQASGSPACRSSFLTVSTTQFSQVSGLSSRNGHILQSLSSTASRSSLRICFHAGQYFQIAYCGHGIIGDLSCASISRWYTLISLRGSLSSNTAIP